MLYVCVTILFVQGSRDRVSAGIRRPYLRVVGIVAESEGPGRATQSPLTPQEEEEMRQLAARPDIPDLIARSIAPSIFGGLSMSTISLFSYSFLSSLLRYKESYCLSAVWWF